MLTKDYLFILFIICTIGFVISSLLGVFLYLKLNIRYIWKLIRRKKKEKMLFLGTCILVGLLTGCMKDEGYVLSQRWVDRPVFFEDTVDVDDKEDEDVDEDVDEDINEDEDEDEIIDLIAPSIYVSGYDLGSTYLLNNKSLVIEAVIEDDISGLSTNVYLTDNGRVYYPSIREDLYVFNINTDYKKDEAMLNEINIVAFDNAGNKGEYSFFINIDVTPPTIDVIINEDFYMEDNTIYINRQEAFEGMEKEFSFDVNIKDNNELKALKIDINNTILTDSLIYTQFYDRNYTMDLAEDKTALTLVATDLFGNLTKREYAIIKDKKPPIVDIIVDKVDIKDVFNNSSLSLVEKFKAYFTKSSPVKIICTAIEDDASGIKEVWFFYEEEGKYKDIRADKAESGYETIITIPSNTKRQIYCAAMDNLLNVNSNNDKYLDIFCNDSVPKIEMELIGNHKIIDNRIYFKGDLKASIDISDELALESYEIKLDDKTLIEETEIFAPKDGENLFVKERLSNLDLAAVIRDKDSCVLEITAQNYGESKYKLRYELIKDEMAPVITNVYFNDLPMKKTEEYEYFYQEALNIYFEAFDVTNIQNITGDKKIAIKCIAENGNEKKEILPEEVGENVYRIMIPASFKGQVIIGATDFLDNEASFSTAPIIIETYEDFLKNTEVLLNHEGEKLYSRDVNVNIEIKNEFCGIKEINYRINAPYDREHNRERLISNPNDDTEFLVKGKDKNINTHILGDILCQNDSNDILITVIATDNAGHSMEKSISFSIDKTYPILDISFSQKELETYNNQNVEVDISVFERNFSKDKLLLMVDGPNKDKVVINDFIYKKDSENPDKDIHSLRLSFDEDGQYTFYIECEDEAKNKTTSKTYSFVVDKMPPKIRIEYDKSFTNEKYTNEPIGAVIIVEETNFDEKDLIIDGLDTILPDTRTWDKDEKGYKLTLLYDTEGEYEFRVKALDLAGNQSESISSKRFIVDFTKPDIEIMGVEKGSANNGKVSPIISFSDVNIDEESPLALFINSGGKILLNPEKKSFINDKIIFSYEDIKREKQYDDLYSLRVSVSDLAGNENKEEIAFSVNRFGSVYTLSENTKDLLNKYTNDEVNIRVIETNTDVLEDDRIRVTLMENGCVNTLEENKDYYINKVYGDFKHQYEYVFDKKLFNNDGSYILSLYSKDIAGNTNESLKKDKEAEVVFGVDKTAPLAFGLNFSEGDRIESYSFRGGLCIKDNMELKDVEILVNGKAVKSEVYDEDYFFSVLADTKKQKIAISAEDKAGNVIYKELGDIEVIPSKNKKTTKGLYVVNIVAIIMLICIGSMIIKNKNGKDY